MINYQEYNQALHILFSGECDVLEYRDIEDPETLTNKGDWVVVQKSVPCHLAFLSAPAGEELQRAIESQQARLFLDNDLHVREGSRFVVRQFDATYKLKQSGIPQKLGSHQEIDVVGEKYV